MNKIFILLLLLLLESITYGQSTIELLDFNFDCNKLSGILNFPEDIEPKGIALIIHGDGKTDAMEGKWWYDVRNSITEAGFATFMWDKMGCGNSEGTYKQGRSVQNEALEVIQAIKHLKAHKIRGSNTFGLWALIAI